MIVGEARDQSCRKIHNIDRFWVAQVWARVGDRVRDQDQHQLQGGDGAGLPNQGGAG